MVSDTCTYITPILDPAARVVMTDSAKWAWYAPANLGVEVIFGSRRDCVASAVSGEVRRESPLWSGGDPIRWEEFAVPDPPESDHACPLPGPSHRRAHCRSASHSRSGAASIPPTGGSSTPITPSWGSRVTGRVLVMPSGRGSSSSSSVLAESLRLGTGPAAIVLSEPDVIIAVGAMAAFELYGVVCPVVSRHPRGGALGIRGPG